MNITLLVLIILVPILAIILLGLNTLLSSHKAYEDKLSQFECGSPVITGQTRESFQVHYLTVGMLFLIFDIELVLFLPLAVSLKEIDIFGFSIAVLFFLILVVGFVFEFGSNAISLKKKSIYHNNNNEYNHDNYQNKLNSIENIPTLTSTLKNKFRSKEWNYTTPLIVMASLREKAKQKFLKLKRKLLHKYLYPGQAVYLFTNIGADSNTWSEWIYFFRFVIVKEKFRVISKIKSILDGLKNYVRHGWQRIKFNISSNYRLVLANVRSKLDNFLNFIRLSLKDRFSDKWYIAHLNIKNIILLIFTIIFLILISIYFYKFWAETNGMYSFFKWLKEILFLWIVKLFTLAFSPLKEAVMWAVELHNSLFNLTYNLIFILFKMIEFIWLWFTKTALGIVLFFLTKILHLALYISAHWADGSLSAVVAWFYRICTFLYICSAILMFIKLQVIYIKVFNAKSIPFYLYNLKIQDYKKFTLYNIIFILIISLIQFLFSLILSS